MRDKVFLPPCNAVAHASVVCLTVNLERLSRVLRFAEPQKICLCSLTPLGGFKLCARWQILKVIKPLPSTEMGGTYAGKSQ